MPEGGLAEFPVKLADAGLTAPGAIAIGVGAVQGAGSNSIEWIGETSIADGAAESAGFLQVTGGTGVNTVQLTVDNGFAFAENGAASLTLEVVDISSPIYAAETGSDATGLGTEAQPLRTITRAMVIAAAVPDIEVIVGPGAYNAAAGEVFPITVPPSTTITGTMGANQDASDSAVVDAEGVAKALLLPEGIPASLTATATRSPRSTSAATKARPRPRSEPGSARSQLRIRPPAAR